MDNCMDCDKHRVIADPDPYDAAGADDEAVVCTAALNPSQGVFPEYVADRHRYRAVTVSCRPGNKRQESVVPAWCPIRRFDRPG